MTEALKPSFDISKVSSLSACKQVAREAGAQIAKETLSRILSGEINQFDASAVSAQLASFVLGCCEEMGRDGYRQQDVDFFRDQCVLSFRQVCSNFRLGLAAVERVVVQ